MPTGTETELRFRLDARGWRALRRAGAFGRPTWVRERLVSTYYDTPDDGLRARRAALRLRRVGRGWVQTLKAAAADGSASRRGEWETTLAVPVLDVARLGDSPVASWLAKPRVRHALAPAFTTDFVRQRARLRRNGAAIEVAVDRGRIVAPRRAGRDASGEAGQPAVEAALHELELELKSGPAGALYDYALRLAAAGPIAVELASKAERGYALRAGEAPAPTRARATRLDRGASVEQAFARIAWDCLGQVQANVEGALRASDGEYLHQLRVGLRRLRSVFSTFRAVLPPGHREAVLAGLRLLGAATGPARDWDVFIAEHLPRIVRALAGAGAAVGSAEALEAHARRARARAHADAVAALAPGRHTPSVLQVMRYLDLAGWRASADADRLAAQQRPVTAFAARTLDRRDRQVRRRVSAAAGGFAAMTVEQRHDLRIAVKKLRYAAEFFACLHARAQVERYASALAAVQDVLGTLNDMAVAPRLLAGALQDPDPALAGAARFALGYCAGVAACGEDRFGAAWKRFERAPRFW